MNKHKRNLPKLMTVICEDWRKVELVVKFQSERHMNMLSGIYFAPIIDEIKKAIFEKYGKSFDDIPEIEGDAAEDAKIDLKIMRKNIKTDGDISSRIFQFDSHEGVFLLDQELYMTNNCDINFLNYFIKEVDNKLKEEKDVTIIVYYPNGETELGPFNSSIDALNETLPIVNTEKEITQMLHACAVNITAKIMSEFEEAKREYEKLKHTNKKNKLEEEEN